MISRLENTLGQYKNATKKININALRSKIQTTIRTLQKGYAVLNAKNSLLQSALIECSNPMRLTFRNRVIIRTPNRVLQRE
ncbi:hypothetical protein HCUR_00361 [Holospora curviuscula]|uniref:Uncharacterized protein n=1 Tax=Holospora curviuscula TaxID=1082868 RepID=A0A2S5RAE3_9PROT|nr:hypothetical protein HCUR_00361 [Holospora curviuscula]